MSRWLILALKWGGLALIALCVAALLHAALIAPDLNLTAMKVYFMLLALGFAFGFAGFRWDRKKREAGG